MPYGACHPLASPPCPYPHPFPGLQGLAGAGLRGLPLPMPLIASASGRTRQLCSTAAAIAAGKAAAAPVSGPAVASAAACPSGDSTAGGGWGGHQAGAGPEPRFGPTPQTSGGTNGKGSANTGDVWSGFSPLPPPPRRCAFGCKRAPPPRLPHTVPPPLCSVGRARTGSCASPRSPPPPPAAARRSQTPSLGHRRLSRGSDAARCACKWHRTKGDVPVRAPCAAPLGLGSGPTPRSVPDLSSPPPSLPLCDIPSGCCFFTGPPRSSGAPAVRTAVAMAVPVGGGAGGRPGHTGPRQSRQELQGSPGDGGPLDRHPFRRRAAEFSQASCSAHCDTSPNTGTRGCGFVWSLGTCCPALWVYRWVGVPRLAWHCVSAFGTRRT